MATTLAFPPAAIKEDFKIPAFFKPANEVVQGDGFQPFKIDVGDDTDQLVRDLRANMKHGVFQLDVTPKAPFGSIDQLFKTMEGNPELAVRANNAYAKNLVYKDAYGKGQGGELVDEKKVIDLSPSRLDTIVSVDSGLSAQFGEPLGDCLSFFDSIRTEIAPKILKALAQVIGDDGILSDNLVNYRMVDYPARSATAVNRLHSKHGPRCGVHRDFGTFTLVFPDGVAGLEVNLEDGVWRQLDVSPGSAVLLFGWCAAIRANDRVPATLHRVADATPNEGTVPRRMSAVFFLAPAPNTLLTPKLIEQGESPIYRSFTALELKDNVGRKWRYREGTLTSTGDIALEEEERKSYPTQDDIIGHLFKN